MAGELILIIEDDERSRKLLRDVLEFHGYRTIEASTGEDGLDLARGEMPCLILLDIRLPGIDGETVFLRLREDPTTATIHVIAVTAFGGTERQFVGKGFDGFIPKPIDVAALPGAVRKFCDALPPGAPS